MSSGFELSVGDYTVSMRRSIGRGTFGTVFPATYNKDGRKIAAKQLDSQKVPHKSAERELVAFQKLHRDHDHENIVKMFDVHEIQNDGLNEVWLMMELCEDGHLQQYFNKHPERFNNINIKFDIICQIASGLEYLHERNIAHRDIKPNNILVTRHPAKPEDELVKIADFGLCKYLDPTGATSAMETECGTRFFKAPELFNIKRSGKVVYHRKVDIFAAGLTYLAMIQTRGKNGCLFPSIEGTVLNDSEYSMPIGQTMLYRINNHKPKVEVVVMKEENGSIANRIRHVIKDATDVEPDTRIDAQKMRDDLLKIKSNSEVEGQTFAGYVVQQGVGESRPPGPIRSGATPVGERSTQQIRLGESSAENSIQYDEAASVKRDAVPIDRHEAIDIPAANGASAQFKPAIPQGDLMKISGKVPPSKLTQFAIRYLGTNMSEISTAKERWREQVELANLEILNNWVQRNPGVTKRKLYELMCKGSKEGWISRDVYSFLLD